MSKETRFHVRFGDPPSPNNPKPPESRDELLRRAMALLEELRLADFLPEEFHAEHDSLVQAWDG